MSIQTGDRVRFVHIDAALPQLYIDNAIYIDSNRKEASIGTDKFANYITDDDILKSGMSHNSILRGKNLGTEVTTEQWQSIFNGTFDDMYIGDYWIINDHKYVIGKFLNYCPKNPTDPVNVPNHSRRKSVVMLDCSQPNRPMNGTDDNSNGYAGSTMRTYMDDVVGPQIQLDFGQNHTYPTVWTVVNSVNSDGQVTGLTSISTIACLPSEEEITGYRLASQYSMMGIVAEIGDRYSPIIGGLPIYGFDMFTILGEHYIGWTRDVCGIDSYINVASGTYNGGQLVKRPPSISYYFRPIFVIV